MRWTVKDIVPYLSFHESRVLFCCSVTAAWESGTYMTAVSKIVLMVMLLIMSAVSAGIIVARLTGSGY